ncbi:hypothetical protein HIM_03062 [Hirsutella minnesotensis 3608]|nr:hypothetical protein HIM_03062 [Hirsutella minnesotensis 3608]
MQRQTPVTSSWNLDSDEIASVTSEDLHENRPNRWIGAKSSWRHLTAEERQLWRSMQQLQGQDLAVHLYDAFALRSCRDPETLRGLTVRTDTGDEVVWAPPKIWTAWPLREHKVPQQSLIPRQNDEDDGFTYRKPEARLPRSELQEELGATILRLAKQRFSKRRWAADEASSDAERVGQADPLTQSSDMSGHEAPDLDSDRMQVDHATDRSCQDEGSSQRAKRRKRESSRTFRPVVSADDDRSYKLLDPCVGHILSRVDRILTILHNARVAGVSHLSDSSTGSDSDSQSSRKRRRGRGRLRRTSLPRERDTSNSVSSPGGGGDGGGGAAGPRRRGRPRKVHIPRDGETLEEMQIRVAREGHRRLPVTQKDRDRAFEEWLRKSDDSKSAHAEEMKQLVVAPEEVASNKESEDGYSTAATTRSHTNIDKKLRRWGLRDWSDVVGAAALAGFPEDVVRRTTRRCARLFGEGMVIRRLEETPLTRGRDLAVVDFEYRPERIAPFTSTSPGAAGPTGARAPGDYYDDLSHDDDDDDSPAPTLQQRRLASLASTPSPRGRRSRTQRPALLEGAVAASSGGSGEGERVGAGDDHDAGSYGGDEAD